jgi:hypothetical protein
VRRLRALVGTVLIALLAAPAVAHVVDGTNVRVVHFEHRADGVVAYLRLLLPLAVGGALGPRQADGSYAPPAPFTINRVESGQVFHYADAAALAAEPLALGRRVADGHRLVVGTHTLAAQVIAVRVWPKGHVPPFNRLDEIRPAMAEPYRFPALAAPVPAERVLVDVALFYPRPGGVQSFSFASDLVPGDLGPPETVSLLVDHAADGERAYRHRGERLPPTAVNPSAAAAARSFAADGLQHVLEGTDHVLFVLCLALGAASFGALAWRITGFTLGHSLTLAAGVFDFAPAAAWFVPLVETAIALSILYAAVDAMRRRGARASAALAALIGLVHGFGFAFALREALPPGAPHLLLSLAAFNAGIEAGQIALVALAWPLLAVLALKAAGVAAFTRAAVACACGAASVVWIVERAPGLTAALAAA